MHNEVRATSYEAGSETSPTWGWLGEPPSQEYAGFLKKKGLEILIQMFSASRREQPKDLSRNQDYMSKFLEKNDKWCLPVIKGVDFTTECTVHWYPLKWSWIQTPTGKPCKNYDGQ